MHYIKLSDSSRLERPFESTLRVQLHKYGRTFVVVVVLMPNCRLHWMTATWLRRAFFMHAHVHS